MKGCLTTEDLTVEEARRRANEGEGVIGMDFVKAVTAGSAYEWDPEDRDSRRWVVARASGQTDEQAAELPPVKYHIVAYDYGLKRNILRRLRQHGFKVRVVPASTSAADVLAFDPDGIFLSPGPGDPSALAAPFAAGVQRAVPSRGRAGAARRAALFPAVRPDDRRPSVGQSAGWQEEKSLCHAVHFASRTSFWTSPFRLLTSTFRSAPSYAEVENHDARDG